MLQIKTPSEQLLYSTVRLCIDDNIIGTAFFYVTRNKKTLLVTNRHVITGCTKIDSSITTANPEKQNTIFHTRNNGQISINFPNYTWYLHPFYDLAACSIDNIKQDLSPELSNSIFYKALDHGHVPNQESLEKLSALEMIVTVGYPQGICDEQNYLPILRTGFTANHPAIDYNNNKIGILDLNNFPGQSGSPVCILNEGSYYSKEGSLMVGSRFFLLGIIQEMSIRYNPIRIRKNDILESNEFLFSQENTGLCYYIKSSELEYFEQFF